jgi:hypothetical protein
MPQTLGVAGPCRSLYLRRRTSPGGGEDRTYPIVGRIAMALQAHSVGRCGCPRGTRRRLTANCRARLEFDRILNVLLLKHRYLACIAGPALPLATCSADDGQHGQRVQRRSRNENALRVGSLIRRIHQIAFGRSIPTTFPAVLSSSSLPSSTNCAGAT